MDQNFRIRIQRWALELGLTGYVEALRNLTLHLVCEGRKEVIENLVSCIKVNNEHIEVKEVNLTYEVSTGEFKTFEIRVMDIPLETYLGFQSMTKYFQSIRN